MLAKYPIWGNNDITRNVIFFFFFSFASTKTLKSFLVILYGETEQQYQKRVF